MKQIIATDKAPKAVGAYSQAVMANGMLFISGQIPINPTTGEMVTGSIEEQARQSMNNIGGILEEAGMTWENVVKTTILLNDIADFAAVNKVYESFFSSEFPARACFEAGNLPKNAGVEIEAIAVK